MNDSRETIIEFLPYGTIMRVNAVDSATGIEVSIQGPIGASQAALERVAIAKLQYKLNKSGHRNRGRDELSAQSGWVI